MAAKNFWKFLSMDPNTTLFHAYFNHGYALRSLIQVLVQEKGVILMLLKPNQIELHNTTVMKNGDNSCYRSIYQCTLNADEIMDYYFNIRGADQELVPHYPIHINIDDLHKHTKDLNKSAGIKLTWDASSTGIIHLTIVNGAMLTDTPPLQLNLTQTAEIMIGDNYDATPNVKVIFQEFRAWLDAVGKHCVEMRIIGKKKSVTISLLDSNHKIISSKTFSSTIVKEQSPAQLPALDLSHLALAAGNINDNTVVMNHTPGVVQPLPMFSFVDPDEVASITIPKTLGIFVALMKLTADKHSILRFYFKEGQPIRIDVASGNFGILSLKVLSAPIAKN